MNREGPALATLVRRLIDTPPDFLAEPKIGNKGVVHVDAVAGDVAALLGGVVARARLKNFAANDANQRNRLAIALLACWLCAEPGFRVAGVIAEDMLNAIDALATELAPHATAGAYHADPDRREELARLVLARLNLRPAGESEAQARDRLISVSAAERNRMVEATRGAVARARAVREALVRKAAEESADKMWRE